MSHNFLLNTRFHRQLLAFDIDLAEEVRVKGCGQCGGPLHCGDFPRIGFGVSGEIAELYSRRISFCCGHCRSRTTPESVRFFGRRRFVSPVLILICALRSSISEWRREQLVRRFGITLSLSTWRRWRTWWREVFTQSQFWLAAKARFAEPASLVLFPRALLNSFSSSLLHERMVSLLRFLSPLSTAAC